MTSTIYGATRKTENVVLIISDGLRWQEVFNGAEEALMSDQAGAVKDTNSLRAEFWRPTAGERRRALLPFIWGEIASRGQLVGNQAKGSIVTVSNGKKFSYPGYNEILTGFGDPQINSNDKKPNPNVTVFEWLNGRPKYHGKAAVFGTWDVFPYIFNIERSRLPIWPAWETRFRNFEIAPPPLIGDLLNETTAIWHDLTYDSFLYEVASAHLKRSRLKLVFIGFGETDEWAHAGRYDQYLKSAHRVDNFVRRLWDQVQASKTYRGKTTFILTADHGRGAGPNGWRDHGEKIVGSEGDWIGIIGPDTPPEGERSGGPQLAENQLAATVAALLGEDFHSAVPKSGAPIDWLIGAK